MEGGKRLKERVKQKKELIPKREYIDNNVIFKINYLYIMTMEMIILDKWFLHWINIK